MAKPTTLRLFDRTYEAVMRYAAGDNQPMNAWIEHVLDVEDTRRRGASHATWMSEHPKAVTFSEARAERNFDDLTER